MEYGIIQNLVRATGRGIWYLADPVEDNPRHSWDDYKENYHSTLVASLLQLEVAQYEITPWPERVFSYPTPDVEDPGGSSIPKPYAQELQQVFNALKDIKQDQIEWLSGTSPKLGVVMSDSLTFQRGVPNASDQEFGHFFGLAMPFIKRGMLIQQNEFRHVRDWWSSGGMNYTTPREHLFEMLGFSTRFSTQSQGGTNIIGKGRVLYLPVSPNNLTRDPLSTHQLYEAVVLAIPEKTWHPEGFISLRRGPHLVAAGIDETEPGVSMRSFEGSFVLDAGSHTLTV